jgi:uncharacterized protein YkwD
VARSDEKLKKFLFVLVTVCVLIYGYDYFPVLETKETDVSFEQADVEKKTAVTSIKADNIIQFMGKSEEEIMGMLGEPERIDPSAYSYKWWIYKKGLDSYMQIGMLDGKVVTIYAIGEGINAGSFSMGGQREEIVRSLTLEPSVSFEYEGGAYRFELSEEDLQKRPITRYGAVFVQLYFDQFLNTLSSIRIMDEETALKHRPYELVYRGDLMEPEPLNKSEWEEIEQGTQQQILDITNVIRFRHHLKSLSWNEKVAVVAYNHSKDMSTQQYFSHVSPTAGDLSDRLETGGVLFTMAGENIAAHYQDSAAAVEGWLNSEGHRKALLNKDFTSLGVGVYQKYYTQNFIRTLP